MATIEIGTPVQLNASELPKLRLPPGDGDLFVAVHPGAMKAGRQSLHTQVVALVNGHVEWVGGLGEDMLAVRDAAPEPNARRLLRQALLRGACLWDVVAPGGLLSLGVEGPLSTVYHGERPWLVVGQTDDAQPIGVPLNQASNPKWYSPLVEAHELLFDGSKRSQIELAHAWRLRASGEAIGVLEESARQRLSDAIRAYYE